MTLVSRHPITAKVDNWASFMRTLLSEYPKLLNEWEEKTSKEFEQIAKKEADGDEEIERSIYSSLCTAFDDNSDKLNIFYQSVFLMCYSYYESCIAQLSKEANTRESIKAICNTKGIQLSKDATEAIDYFQDKINALRNNITHNNFGTYRKVDTLKEISTQNIGLTFEGDTLQFNDASLITDVLNKAHLVLHELCEKLGYKPKSVGKQF